MGKPPLSYQFPGRLLPNLADQIALREAESVPRIFELPHMGKPEAQSVVVFPVGTLGAGNQKKPARC
ncbi:hypothetical protein HMPREF1862_01091 [Varibaculum cambriense]|uniref:Uncharacterized protein n=1 Tax=Varibaculum cambriense TaxID=184870 RepID=A0AB34WZJ0_9ACTO|nr:hypothetical protein HMPREF1862_01091 [Varibaculum cambriense]